MKRRYSEIAKHSLLRLPSVLLLHCLSYAVNSFLGALTISKVCKALQQYLRQSPRVFENVCVSVSGNNGAALSNVHPFWQSIHCRTPTTVQSLCPYLVAVRGSISDDMLLELTHAPHLRQLKIGPVHSTTLSGLRQALPYLQQLESLVIPYEFSVFTDFQMPPRLLSLSVHHLSPLFAVLPITKLSVRLCPTMTALSCCPHLQSLKIDSSTIVNDVLDFAFLSQLTRLILWVHASFSVPMSLRELSTFQSNELIGERPLLQTLKLFKRDVPIDPVPLNYMCSIPTLREVLFQGYIHTSTIQILASLPALDSLWLLDANASFNLTLFPRLTSLTILECRRNARLFDQATNLKTLLNLAICESDISDAMLLSLVQQLPSLQRLEIGNCNRVNTAWIRKQCPAVIIN